MQQQSKNISRTVYFGRKKKIDVQFFLRGFDCVFVLGKGTPIPIRIMIPGAIQFSFNVVKPDARASQDDL